MLPESIKPIPQHPGIVDAYGPTFTDRYVQSPNTRAWRFPDAIVLLSNIVKGHKAHLEFAPWYPSDIDVIVSDNEVRLFLAHVIKLYDLKVIYAIVPVEGADLIQNLATRLGFKQDGVLRDNRISPDGFATTDDLIYTLKASWLRSGPRLRSQ